jgi:hypothetical protein
MQKRKKKAVMTDMLLYANTQKKVTTKNLTGGSVTFFNPEKIKINSRSSVSPFYHHSRYLLRPNLVA